MGRMTDWIRKKLWLERETGQSYTRLKNTNTTEKYLKQWLGEKNVLKNTGIYNTCHWATIPGMDRWEILIPILICNVNQSNEQYITLIKGCIGMKSHILSGKLYWPELQHF